MPIEIIGLFSHRNNAEHRPQSIATFDLPFLTKLVQDYDRNGYDRMLIANAATWPDSIPFAAYIAAITERVGFMIAHRPGFVAPTMTARMLATIDRLSNGRVAVHIITGASDKELQADGDFSTKARRYARSGEYVDVLRRMWSSDTPFDHEGEFYHFNNAFSVVKPVRPAGIPVYWGGSSPEAIAEAGRCADVYAIGVDAFERVGNVFAEVRAAAAAHGRSPRFCLSARLIVADKEVDAWAKAEEVLRGAEAQVQSGALKSSINSEPTARYRELASLESCIDNRLWIGLTKLTKGTKAVTSLVGTHEQVVDELMHYYDLGVTSFLISGFDYTTDPDELGRTVIPILRARVAEREALARQAAS